jgi:hypothetical protein
VSSLIALDPAFGIGAWDALSKIQHPSAIARSILSGVMFEALLRKARQLRTASQIDRWLSSPALQAPK